MIATSEQVRILLAQAVQVQVQMPLLCKQRRAHTHFKYAILPAVPQVLETTLRWPRPRWLRRTAGT